MAEELNVTSMLIEGFDARKLAQEEVYDRDWQQVVGAKQNDKILQSEIVGIESIRNTECAVVHVGKIKGYIPLEFTGVENLRGNFGH
ncbi:hypothetical protein ACA29_02950 [Lederbergia galactosidilytica]|uniref:Uncharacterized protein n=1 Tax=Lederbergia galactosidilytica TaxID=217031 RepID=A0A0Q9Y7S1_9BACI|nr:hypothetical protein ACA29_02950 [Lederbergia galactosidilytica]